MMDYRRPSKPGKDKGIPSTPIYASFAPPPIVTNGTLPETVNMWWDEDRIEATVTRQFVCSHLRSDEVSRLDEPLGFGDGLTDDTYYDWIENKAKRIFLILVDLGVPDQIFGVIDDSWDDDDLPLQLEFVERLALTYDKDEKLERKFYQRQFVYLLRHIQKGDHLVYDHEEVVPLELAEKKVVGNVAGLSQNSVDKVHLPGRPDDIFVRRRIPLGHDPGCMPQEEFLSGVQAMKAVEHNHLMSIWASYIQHDCGYLLLTPANDSNLKKFLDVTPQSIKILAKSDRRVLLLNWIHCLADAVAFLHSHGQAHGNIKPSNVLLDQDNHIFLGDAGVFSSNSLTGDRRGFDKESYDYTAPEYSQRAQASSPVLVSVATSSSRGGGGGGGGRRPTITSGNSATLTSMFSHDSTSISPTSSISSSPPGSSPSKRNSLTRYDPQKGDIFSLGAIILEILTFFMKKTSKNFSSHRSAKNKTPGRGGGLPDSSFYKNLAQVDSWRTGLKKDASKKDDAFFRGVERILVLTEKMLSISPIERPDAAYVKDRINTILRDFCHMGFQGTTNDGKSIPSKGIIHCDGAHQIDETEFHFGFEDLRIASQKAAAAACANISAHNAESRTVGINGGIVYGAELNVPPPSRTYSLASSTYSGGLSFSRVRNQEADRMSTASKSSKSSGGSKSKSGSTSYSGSNGYGGHAKVKPKAKAWKAPVYAGECQCHTLSSFASIADSHTRNELCIDLAPLTNQRRYATV